MDNEQFPGQQDGERVLYVVTPHALRKYLGIFRVLMLVAAAVYLWDLASIRFEDRIAPENVSWGYAAIAVLGLGFVWWTHRSYNVARAYITDRRVIRFEAVFPNLEKRRALFWSEVTKAKGTAKNFLWRMINVGTVEVMPFVSEVENIELPYSYYFEDIASFIDKLVFLRKSKSEDLDKVRPFVPRPKGKRYPLENEQHP